MGGKNQRVSKMRASSDSILRLVHWRLYSLILKVKISEMGFRSKPSPFTKQFTSASCSNDNGVVDKISEGKCDNKQGSLLLHCLNSNPPTFNNLLSCCVSAMASSKVGEAKMTSSIYVS